MEDGIYVAEKLAGYEQQASPERQRAPQNISRQIVWRFKADLPNSFFSTYISGVQRLPNGNTLVCSGAHGHFFEVTTDGEVVWEYISPVGDRFGANYGIHTLMTDEVDARANDTFRCVRYAPEYAGLAGRDLAPMGKITELYTQEPVPQNPIQSSRREMK
jgi:hypothetical protein